MKNEILYGYIFLYNCYEEVWCAIKKEEYQEFNNGNKKIQILKNKDIQVIIDYLNKGGE